MQVHEFHSYKKICCTHCGNSIGDVRIIHRTLRGSGFLFVAFQEFFFGQKNLKMEQAADAKNVYAYWWVLLIPFFKYFAWTN